MLKNAGTILQHELENEFDITITVDAYMRTKERLFDAAGFAAKAKQGVDYAAAPGNSADSGQEQPGLIRRRENACSRAFRRSVYFIKWECKGAVLGMGESKPVKYIMRSLY